MQKLLSVYLSLGAGIVANYDIPAILNRKTLRERKIYALKGKYANI